MGARRAAGRAIGKKGRAAAAHSEQATANQGGARVHNALFTRRQADHAGITLFMRRLTLRA